MDAPLHIEHQHTQSLWDGLRRRNEIGNAVFSRWPIRRAGVIRLPEQYNWYFDRQKRIGGRLAVFAELAQGKEISPRQGLAPGQPRLRSTTGTSTGKSASEAVWRSSRSWT